MFVFTLACMLTAHAADAPDHVSATKACEDGETARCYVAGLSYFDGTGGAPRDRFRAMQLYRLGCRGEDLKSCVALADALADGEGGQADAMEILEPYQQACARGAGLACRRMGDEKVLSASDSRDAALWYSLGCELKDGPSCTATALAYERGDGEGGADLERARRYFLAACRYGSGRGCALLGYRYSRGLEGVKRDDSAALVLFGKGCDASDPEACRYLAEFQERGRGGARPDPDAAALTYQRGCRAGDILSCREVATTLLASRDYRGAMLAGRLGCELGDPKCCKLQSRAQANRP